MSGHGGSGGGGNATSSGGGGGGGYSAPSAAMLGYDPEDLNMSLNIWLLVVLAVVAGLLIFWRCLVELTKYVRTVTSLNNETQKFYAREQGKMSWFKRNVLYAPMFRKRHNREFQLSTAVNVGTLPTRLQMVLLIGYFATNVVFSVIDVPFSSSYSTAAQVFRNRTGTLATVNLIPLFLLAGRNNPLIKILNVSFDTMNLMHRWLGRIVILESLAHTVAFLASSSQTKGLGGAFAGVLKSQYMLYGLIATIALLVIGVQANSIFRHAFYETFKIVHIALAALVVAMVWYHLLLKMQPQIQYMYAVIAIWAFDRLARFLRIVYHNVGRSGTKTLIEALPGNACRVTVTLARPWFFRPGQHAYLYMPKIGLWQSHPFSVAWSEETGKPDGEKLPMDRRDVLGRHKTSMSFVIRSRTGFTRSLYRKAAAQPDGKLLTTAYIEGPYGGRHLMHSYGTVMLFAGGVGITQMVPHVRDLVIGYANGTVATRKVVLVWTLTSPEHLEWIRPWMTEILALEKRRDVLRVMLFVSRPRSTKEIHSPSSTVQMFPGRPNIDTLMGIEMENQVGKMGVMVCGPGPLSDDVRRAVRDRQYQGSVDFVEEAFSW